MNRFSRRVLAPTAALALTITLISPASALFRSKKSDVPPETPSAAAPGPDRRTTPMAARWPPVATAAMSSVGMAEPP